MEIIAESKPTKFGGFWRRFVAILIDGIVLFFVQIILYYIIFGDVFYSPGDLTYDGGDFDEIYSAIDWGAYAFLMLLDLSIRVLYFAGMHSSAKQATIGKMVLDMKVVDSKGDRISFLRGVGRNLSKIISGMILLIGYIMAAFDSKKRALHDYMADTYVIVVEKEDEFSL